MRSILSLEGKQRLVEKVLSREGKSVAEIAKENNIGYSTLQKWVRYSRCGKLVTGSVVVKPELSRLEKFNHILETSKLTESELGAYCREKGLYGFELKNWKERFMVEDSEKKASELLRELKQLRVENKSLKQELQRKDKALSETAALLILKKKANLIWGEYEEVL